MHRESIARFFLGSAILLAAPRAFADLPTGYLVWTKGEAEQPATRRIHRLTLPARDQELVLTTGTQGEDIEPQISPDGRWVAFARAKASGIDYLAFSAWKVYLVSIHGVGDGREELKIDDNGYWPSWGADGSLYFSQADDPEGQHSRIIRVVIGEYGEILEKKEVIVTRASFGDLREVNECFFAPDGTWFAARTRGPPGDTMVSGVGEFGVSDLSFEMLGQAGTIGCQPHVAPSSTWGFIAGREHGILWGHGPNVPGGLRNQQLIVPGTDELCYHPGISSDEAWFMAGCSTDDNHNDGHYDLKIYKLSGQSVSDPQPLVSGGFNGWPHLWVGEPGPPPPSRPHVDVFRPSSYTILTGQSVTLDWQTSFADRVTLDGAAVSTDGSRTLSLSATTITTLEAKSSTTGDSRSATVEITVNAEAQPVSVASFTVEPSTVPQGVSAVLKWRLLNAYTVDLEGRAVAPVGELEVSPSQTHEYTIVAQGHAGPVTQKVTLTVQPLDYLLPDRGGCMCSDTASFGSSPSIFLLALALLLRPRKR
jgi:hypothetical protein